MEPLTFAEVQEELKKPEVTLVDVRPDEEIKTDGKIEQSKNIPIGDLPAALELSDAEFEEKYGFPKPGKDSRVITHCKAGMRGQRAATAFKEAGFSNVGVYSGIADWKNNGGPVV
ncbi:rhodanese domain-containing protein CG4456 [Folsomia candida]|uniref:Putative thiosulfate sulfurtransferase, mitochondrial n=1 Tax=Folsomia candida TaxID=158441 RepID=A0A226EJB0_FOLCA|nr:rhodanese domain-containing protein CG4456 [Folsomia candida]OXA56841.1 putative thiosulfate sulfurtransferase, mitochondrial [Folsomia candida]